MAQIFDIKNLRENAARQKLFGLWERRFGQSYGMQTRLADLSDQTLYELASPGDDNAVPYYEFIMAVLDLGAAGQFHYLDDEVKMQVVDLHLFLADHVRFELMRRLGWVRRFVCENYTLVEMVRKSADLQSMYRGNPPELSRTHPRYNHYIRLISREKEVFIRQMLRDALEAFSPNVG